jgi:hypothetical protein
MKQLIPRAIREQEGVSSSDLVWHQNPRLYQDAGVKWFRLSPQNLISRVTGKLDAGTRMAGCGCDTSGGRWGLLPGSSRLGHKKSGALAFSSGPPTHDKRQVTGTELEEAAKAIGPRTAFAIRRGPWGRRRKRRRRRSRSVAMRASDSPGIRRRHSNSFRTETSPRRH